MKKIIAYLFFILTLFSCTPKEVSSPDVTEIIKVESVVFPTTFTKDVVSTISINYVLPTSCHKFTKFQYLKIGNTRTVAVETSKSTTAACNPSTSVATDVLSFKPTELGVFYFRFLKGKDAAGVDIYFEFYATVTN